MKVLIQHGLVHEIFGEVAPELHEDMLVVDAPDYVKQGWVWTGEDFTAPDPIKPSYAEQRRYSYPSIQDQLDMLYWDKVNGTNQWQQAITTIKATYPKDDD